ncbi:MAG: glycosyltransferase family 2 protein [Deltaproteobacteria bacterium]|nr:glycosyltransferase family 2 protein [Deltaproteobacteria bacterium]
MEASVIIPTFRRTAFLLDTLASVGNQALSGDRYEVIIVDNAPDATPELQVLQNEGAMPPIRYMHEPLNGLHNARHAGARHARGEILVYVDDDVLCPFSWLGEMLAPYTQSDVALVAGKVVLRHEVEPPPWLGQFSGILSALDRGDTAHRVEPYGSPVGCNMSIRKSVLFSVGGFNPDGFGDPSLLHLRGDGECGLARKVHDAGWTVWYAPEAWLEHRVPSGRMTREYIEWRSAIGGIEAAYADLRYHRRSTLGLLTRALFFASCSLAHRVWAEIFSRDSSNRMRSIALAKRYQYQSIQRWRQAASENLRRETFRSDYLHTVARGSTAAKLLQPE